MTLASNILWGALAVLTLAVAPASAEPTLMASPLISQRPLSQRPTLMVLGSVHLGNPNRDLHDADVDDVLAPERQRQIEAVVDALATWKPTRVAVEWSHKYQAKLDQRYADYRAGRLKLKADEVDQIGLRLAAELNLPRVDAVDWLDENPGTDADYDWQVGAKLGHEEARFAALSDPKISRDLTELVREHTVAGFLRIINKPAYLADLNRVDYDLALLGGPEVNPGANWVGAWHARNLKILDNLIRLDAAPTERILLVIGAGHAYLLNEYAPDSHAFRLERPDAWLPAKP
jgi:hypothetical protein